MTAPTTPARAAHAAAELLGDKTPPGSAPLDRDGRGAPAETSPCPVLRAQGITKSYRRGLWPRRQELVVLRGAEVQLCAGEIVGLVGENGSG